MSIHAAGIYIDRITQSIMFRIEAIDVFKNGSSFNRTEGMVFPEGELLLL
jgi:hypothetical protein